jgi:hypothetical protein
LTLIFRLLIIDKELYERAANVKLYGKSTATCPKSSPGAAGLYQPVYWHSAGGRCCGQLIIPHNSPINTIFFRLLLQIVQARRGKFLNCLRLVQGGVQPM